MRRPFMHHPDQLASLEGQQYLVLRPAGVVSDLYRGVQDAALSGLGRGLKHPHTEHVTLRGFFEPERRDELAGLVRDWAASQPPIEVVAEAVDSFAAPWQIIIVRLARTASLVSAYASLTTALDATDLRRLGELSLDEWTFHLSVVYAKTLDQDAWAALELASCRDVAARPTETIAEAELVWYVDGVEHAEVIPLGG